MVDAGTSPAGEELSALQEQLADARAEVERLQADAANAEARAVQSIFDADGLREDLRVSHDASGAAAAEATSLRDQLDAATQRAHDAAERYRDLVVKTEPALPAELIAGDDIDAVDASVAAAREIVGRVRSHIETQAQSVRVPAGAPQRAAPDLSALTPEQKIRYGLARRE